MIELLPGEEVAELDILDSSGKIVKIVHNYAAGESIDVSELQSGMYTILVKSAGNQKNASFVKISSGADVR